MVFLLFQLIISLYEVIQIANILSKLITVNVLSARNFSKNILLNKFEELTKKITRIIYA